MTTLTDTFRQERERLAEAFLANHDADAYLHGHSRALDAAVCGLIAETGLTTEQLCVMAVGGYGRAELFPFSDIDLLILVDNEADSRTLSPCLTAFVTRLWELGLSVGASVRNETEFLNEAARDVSVATTYLESRLLQGNAALYERARAGFRRALNPQTFFRDKMLERRRRHEHFEDTPYSLEPNLKESPGGLRDIQVFLWCAQAAGLAQTIPGMAAAGLITQREMHTLNASLYNLKVWRIALHLLTGRHEDRLIFDVQEALSQALGYKAGEQMRASEAFMKRYYLNAKAVVQLSVIELQTLADRINGYGQMPDVAIDEVFVRRGEELDIVNDRVFERDRHAMLRAFYLFSKEPGLTRYSTRLLRALWLAVPAIDEAFRTDPVNQAQFLALLQMPRGTYHALRDMNMWDVLGRFLPDFRPIVGQMQHDLYHIFTVDQHTLRVVRNIRRFAHSQYAHEYPECARIMSSIDRSWRLVVAGLFHDIGKGAGGNHADVGAQKMQAFGRAFGLAPEDVDFMTFLVREHLLMSQVAQRRDISDPDVLRRFNARVGTRERLDALYLLTVADIRATSPKVWTPWKAQLLETLYRHARSLMGGNDTTAETLKSRCATALDLMQSDVSKEERTALWNELNVVYFMRHSAAEIAWHTDVLAARRCETAPLVRVKHDPQMGGTVVLLYLPDRKDLFLRAVAYLGRCGLSVMDARIHTTRHGWALDTFLVADRYERYTPGELRDKVEREMPDALVSEAALPAAPRGKLSRRSRHFPIRPRVRITPDEAGTAWILTLVCTDRLGLLLAISQVLAKYSVNLQTAKIATLGERVEDVFLIDGAALADDAVLLALEADLLEAISLPALKKKTSR